MRRSHREVLQSMPSLEAKLLVLPIVCRKVLEVDPSSRSRQALNDLARHWRTQNSEPRDPAASLRHRILVSALESMELKPLLVALRYSALDRHPEAASIADVLLRRLRDSVAVR